MTTIPEIQKQNEELARRINEEARSNPQSPYVGKFVGIANGQVVAVTHDLDELGRLLVEAETDPRKTYWIEASRDYSEVHEIWGLR
jgi:hypothetical protein